MDFYPGIYYLHFPRFHKKSLRALTFSIGSEQILFVAFDLILINLLMTLQLPLTLSSY